MKASFLYLLSNNKKINCYVVHQIKCQKTLLSKLHENDIVFFDDCLYSQYLFIKNNIVFLKEHNITCVLSFSTNIYRRSGKPVDYAECAQCHDRFHNGDMSVLQCYMSLDEVKELTANDNIYLACHGHNHLQLEKINNKRMQSKLFSNDIQQAVKHLKDMNTNIFVFPYAYDDFPFAYTVLKRNKFFHIFAGKNTLRTQLTA